MNDDPGRARLDRSLISAVAWTGGSKWLLLVITWPITLLIARTLNPADYGIVAMASVYTRLIALIVEAGLGSAIVLAKDMDRKKAGQFQTISVVLAGSGFIISCIVAYPIAGFFRNDALVPVIIALSFVFVVESVFIAPAAMLARSFRFKHLALMDSGRSVVDVTVGLVLALLGFGYWALVGGFIAGVCFSSASANWLYPVGFVRPDLPVIRANLILAMHFLLRNMATFLCSTVDVIIAGRLLGEAGVGAYSFALSLARLPLDKITAMVTRVTPSLFAHSRHDLALLRRYFLLLTRTLSLAVFPALIGLIIVTPDAVPVILGPQWGSAVVPLQLMSFYGLIASMSALLPQILQATGQERYATRQGGVALLVLPPLFLVFGARWGASGIAAAWVIGYPATMVGLFLRVKRMLCFSAAELVISLIPACVASAAMSAAVLGLQFLLPLYGLSVGNRLVLCIIVGAAVYLSVLLLLFHDRLREMIEVLKTVRHRNFD